MMCHRLALVAWSGAGAVLLAACAAAPPPRPAAPVEPPAPAAAVPAPPAPPPLPVQQAPEPPTAPTPTLLLTPEQRSRAQSAAEAALENALASTHGDRGKLRAVLGIPANITSPTVRYLSERLLDAVADPAFVHRLVAKMTDLQLSQVQRHPSLVMEIAGASVGQDFAAGFNALDSSRKKELLRLVGEIFTAATPAECPMLLNKGGAHGGDLMFRVADRLPPESQQRFAAVMVDALVQPPSPPPAPLTAPERDLVLYNVRHYFYSQPDEARARFDRYFHGDRQPGDECWVIGQMMNALLSGDADIADLGIRFFTFGLSTHGR